MNRRSHRVKHDAAAAGAALSGWSREEIDLDALGGALLAVLREMMRLTNAGMWLREVRR